MIIVSIRKGHMPPFNFNMIRSLFLVILSFTINVQAQDTLQWVRYYGGMDLNDGLYFNFNDLKYNRPSVPKEELRNSQGLKIDDIRTVVSKLHWQPDTGERRTVRMHDLWGFCQNDAVYIAAGNGFYRVGLLGSISHMMYEETFRDWDPMYSHAMIDRQQTRHLILDMRTGEFLPFNAAGMDKALQQDPVLLEEFRSLKKKHRNSDEALFRFLRSYNESHPLEFPL